MVDKTFVAKIRIKQIVIVFGVAIKALNSILSYQELALVSQHQKLH